MNEQILQKLRAELESMKRNNNDDSEYTKGILATCDYTLDLLNEIEKEQPQVFTSTAIADIGKCGGVITDWTPTPLKTKRELEIFEQGVQKGAEEMKKKYISELYGTGFLDDPENRYFHSLTL